MAKVCRGIRLAVLAVIVLLQGVASQDEEPIDCYGSSGCGSSLSSLPYSECCSQGVSFIIDGTCYECAELISFTETTYSVSEDANFIAIPVQRTVNPGTSFFLFRTFIYDGSATVGTDLGQFPDSGVGLISFFTGDEATTNAVVVIIDDNVVEHNETFTVGLQLVSNTFSPIGDIMGNATVTILDDDKVNITLDPSNATVMEPSEPLEFTVRKMGEAVRSVSVVVDLRDPELNFSSPGSDIRTLNFPSDVEEMSITISVPDDDIVEATEEHNIVLRVPGGETGVNLVRTFFPITVEDTDTLEISMAEAAVNVREEDRMVTVGVRKNGENERPLYVTFVTEADTAEAGSDFTSVNTVLEFLPNDDMLFVEVNVSADGIVESTERFLCRLGIAEGETGVTIPAAVTTVSIVDSDLITVSADAAAVEVSEGEEPTSLYLRVTEGMLARQASVDVSVSPRDTQDITVTPSTLTFDSTNLNLSLTLNVTDDDLYEGVESVTLSVTSSDSAIHLSPSPLVITISIADNDSPQLTFSESVYSFNETSEQVEVIVTFGAETETAHSWNLTFTPVTATEGEDYIPSAQGRLTFSNDVRIIAVPFEIIDDLFSEGLETLLLELRGEDGVVVNSSEVQIVDNEKLRISFTQSTYSASEGDQFVVIELEKSGLTTSDIRVGLEIKDMTARGGVDYGFFPSSMVTLRAVILSSETSILYGVLIREDDRVENTESFNVSLLLTGSDETTVLGNITSADVFIEDNDQVRIFLTLEGDNQVSEADSAGSGDVDVIFIVSRDPNITLDRDVTVTLTTTPDTAGPDDFVSVSQEFTFSNDGSTSFRRNITVKDDDVVENIEQFFVSLEAPPGETGVILPENATAIVITSEDKIQVDFVRSNYTVNEGDSFVTINVAKTGSNEIPVMVAVETITADDTATAGEDYNATVQPLEFLSDVTVLPLTIPIVDDSVLEETERFTVELAVTANDTNVSLGTNRVTEVTIVDDDSVTVEFAAADYRVGEDEGSVLVTVVKIEDTEKTVQVQFITSDGTADSDDYTPVNRVLTFPPGGRMEEVVEIGIIDNDACEGAEEEFSVSLLSLDSGVVLGELRDSTVTIVEDDRCGVGFEDPSYTVMEPGPAVRTNLTVCVERQGESNQDITMAIITETIPDILVDHQAIEGVDYMLEPSPMFLTLLFNEENVCFNITIMGDNREEEMKLFKVRMIISEDEFQAFRSEANVTIMDEITPPPPGDAVVEFESPTFGVRESAGQVEIGIRAVREEGADDTFITVLFRTEDGKATSPEDFEAQTDVPVNFGPGVTRRTVTVPIVTDNLEEGPESFIVHLSLPAISFGVELGDVSTATVTIADSAAVVNDTVLGDPLFVVPLFLTDDSHSFEEPPSLCYEIHGQSGWYFNLVSDECTSVNAHYTGANNDQNVITEIGVKAVSTLGECIDVRVAIENDCVPEITRQGQTVSLPRYSQAGVTVSRRGRGVRVSVPNCANFQLVMWITCRVVGGQGQMRFDIARGFNLRPTSHGLLGQFWNIPIRVTPFVFRGKVNYDLQEQELYEVEVDPTDSSPRRFVAEFYELSWDQTRTDTCLYAGDQQGGRIREISNPNDPVIQGRYLFYRTNELFETQFRYSQFNTSLCD